MAGAAGNTCGCPCNSSLCSFTTLHWGEYTVCQNGLGKHLWIIEIHRIYLLIRISTLFIYVNILKLEISELSKLEG